MRKVKFLLVPLLACGQLAFCQSSFGLNAGLNLSDQHLTFTPPKNPTIQPTSFLGYRFGAFYKAMLNKKWNIFSELNYFLIGSRALYQVFDSSDSTGISNRRYSNKIGYLEVPLGLQYSLGNVYLGIGPSIAFRIFHKVPDKRNTSYYKTIDVAGNILAGYKIAKKVDINVAYTYGLTNILKEQSLYGAESYATIKNRVVKLSILYRLN